MPALYFVYLVCFGVGLLFAIISAIFGHVLGGGHDAHGEIGMGGHAEAGFDHMPGFSPFSPTIIATFVTTFGGLGLILSKFEATENPWISAPLAGVGGIVIAAAVFLLFDLFFTKTQSSSEAHVSGLVGCSATVITPIPANGVGEVAYNQGGTRYTAAARCDTGAPIESGRTVKIARVVASQLYVTPA